jgi:hypothetical protein
MDLSAHSFVDKIPILPSDFFFIFTKVFSNFFLVKKTLLECDNYFSGITMSFDDPVYRIIAGGGVACTLPACWSGYGRRISSSHRKSGLK